MTAKKLIICFMVALFSLGLASLGLSGGMGEAKGTVTKIEGSKVTIKDSMGMEKTVEPKNPEALNDLKVGDQASVKEGTLTKEDGSEKSAPSPGTKPKY